MRNSPPPRLAKLAHYVIARTPPHQLGATKLNKVLWRIDCAAYRRWGNSISGVDNYVRLQHGPVPDGIRESLQALKAGGAVRENALDTYAGVRREFVALTEPPVQEFSAEEIDLISQVMSAVVRMTAAEASEASHDALWQETDQGASISVAAGSVLGREICPDDLEWARSELGRINP